LVSLLTTIYNTYSIDPGIKILINMALTNTSVQSTKQKHPLIQWPQYAQIITEQTQIGWYQIKYGCFSLAWYSKQQQYDNITCGTNDPGAPKWFQQVINTIWTFAQSRWLARCQKQHGQGHEAYNIQQEALFQ
jgi:hypothetical protein